MPVVAEFRGRNRHLNQKIDESQRKMRGMQEIANKGVNIGGVIGATAILAALQNVAQEFDRIEKLSRQLRTSAEDVQRLNFIGSQNGVDLEKLSKGLSEIDRKLGDLGRQGIAARALRRLNIEAEEFAELDMTERLFRLAQAWQESNNKAAAGADLYELAGRNGREMIGILSQGEATLRALAANAPVVDQESVENIARFNDQLDLLEKRGRAAGAEVLSFVQKQGDNIGGTIGGIIHFGESLAEGRGLAESFNEAVDAAKFAIEDMGDEAADTARDLDLAQAVAEFAKEADKLQEKVDQLAVTDAQRLEANNAGIFFKRQRLEALEEEAARLAEIGEDDKAILETERELQETRRDLNAQLIEQAKLQEAATREPEKAAAAAEKAAQRAADLKQRRLDAATEPQQLLDREEGTTAEAEKRVHILRDELSIQENLGNNLDAQLEIKRQLAEAEIELEESLKRQADLRERIAEAEAQQLAESAHDLGESIGTLGAALQQIRNNTGLTAFEQAGGRFEGSESLSSPFDAAQDAMLREMQSQTRKLDAVEKAIEAVELRHEESQHG